MLSAQVRTMLKGYGNHATQLGYQKKGALPLTEAEMQLLQRTRPAPEQLLQSTRPATVVAQTHTSRCSCCKMACCSACCGSHASGASHAGALRLGNIVLPTGENAVPYLVPESRLQAGAVLHLLPDTTKNKKGGHCRITLKSEPSIGPSQLHRQDKTSLHLTSDLCTCQYSALKAPAARAAGR